MKNRKIIIIILLFISLVYLGYKYYDKPSFNEDSMLLELGYDKFTFDSKTGGIDRNEYKLVYKKFSGFNSVWSVLSKENCTIKITFESKVIEGNFKVVLISTDSKVINVLEQNDKGSKSFDLKNGDTRIRIVGEKASGEIFIKIESEDSIELIPYYAITK